MSHYDDFPKYVSMDERKMKAEKIKERLSKKRTITPVTAEKRGIAVTWWGLSWIRNLEGYADYSSRLPRGRTYLRSGAVVHLEIENGVISALVAGSRAKPYEIAVTIAPLKPRTRERLVEKCRKSITSLSTLLAGSFPQDLEASFLARGDGLFPSPAEIHFECTCPDWADMCKHVSAVLYGAAVRLDEKPELFFTLRGIDVNDFVGAVIEEERKSVTKKPKKTSKRVLSDTEASKLFGI